MSVSETFPLPSMQGLEIDFLENRSSNFEKHVDGCKFDTNKQKFTPISNDVMLKDVVFSNSSSKENRTRLKNTHELLLAAIQSLKEREGHKNAHIAAFDISQSRTWEDVIAAVKAAEEKYLQDDSTTGKIRKAFRQVEDNASSIQPFIGMLPDGEYKTLCGGLTLILKVRYYCYEDRHRLSLIIAGYDEES